MAVRRKARRGSGRGRSKPKGRSKARRAPARRARVAPKRKATPKRSASRASRREPLRRPAVYFPPAAPAPMEFEEVAEGKEAGGKGSGEEE